MKKLFFFLTLCLLVCKAYAGGTKTDYRNALIFAYAQSSFDDGNIRLEIYNQTLWATNLTTKTIFLDLSQCFLVNNGQSQPMYSKKDKETSKKSGNTTQDEFLTLAPVNGSGPITTAICDMSLGIMHEYGTSEGTNNDFTEYEKRLLNMISGLLDDSKNADPKKKEYLGAATRHLTEDESVSCIGASIAYAFNKRAEDWNSVSISTWVSDVIFSPYYVVKPKDLSKKEQRGFGVKETKPAEIHVKADQPFEFEMDKSPVIVCDWEGNFKKGTFELSDPIVTRTKVNVGKVFSALFVNAFDALSAVKINEYKRTISFDGTKVDWGKMDYVSSANQTGQEK